MLAFLTSIMNVRNKVSLWKRVEFQICCSMNRIRKSTQGFPGGAVVNNPPANAGRHGFEPWPGKIPHAVEQLSLCTATTEPAL